MPVKLLTLPSIMYALHARLAAWGVSITQSFFSTTQSLMSFPILAILAIMRNFGNSITQLPTFPITQFF